MLIQHLQLMLHQPQPHRALMLLLAFPKAILRTRLKMLVATLLMVQLSQSNTMQQHQQLPIMFLPVGKIQMLLLHSRQTMEQVRVLPKFTTQPMALIQQHQAIMYHHHTKLLSLLTANTQLNTVQRTTLATSKQFKQQQTRLNWIKLLHQLLQIQ